MIDYRLIVLTHGGADPLPRTLASFAENVTPPPGDVYLNVDGAGVDRAVEAVAGLGWELTLGGSTEPEGFCMACWECWEEAAASPYPYVFWLEHDFEFVRPVDLTDLADVLDAHPELAQMALMRQAVNPAEIAAGGVKASRAADFIDEDGWMMQRAYWTTNPCLIPVGVPDAYAWPAGDGCEGRFSISMREAGLEFGVWGSGEEWVAHHGVRTGFGY